MALVICPDCKGSVSNKAKACPKCGRNLRYWTIGKILLALILAPIVFFIFAVILPYCGTVSR